MPCRYHDSPEGVAHSHHGLLVLRIFNLSCGKVDQATLYWVTLVSEDKDVGSPYHLLVKQTETEAKSLRRVYDIFIN